MWPREDPEARSVHTQEHGTSGRVNTVNLPEGVLVDGKTYGWQARVGDGAELSAWSKKCFFTYDRTRPSTPVVTSANYPVDGAAPPGVLSRLHLLRSRRQGRRRVPVQLERPRRQQLWRGAATSESWCAGIR
nr:hypothetical protein GCM10020092_106420 [Actinoplanes digitatis]